MHDRDPRPDDVNATEAHISMRKAHREATSSAERLAERLEEIDIHQREARYLLERAGLLARRHEPSA
jgi:hypothetical protein